MNKWTIKKKAEENNELETKLVERLNYTFNSIANNTKESKYLLQDEIIDIIKKATNTALQNFINVHGNNAEQLPFYYITFFGKALGKTAAGYATSIMDVKKFKTEEEAQAEIDKILKAFTSGNSKGFQINYCANKEDINKIKIF